MGKALLGTHVDPATLRLLDEVRALRRRVAELEAALAAVDASRDADARVERSLEAQVDDREPAGA